MEGKKLLCIILVTCSLSLSNAQGQFLKDIRNIFGSNANGLTEQDAVAGIREALIKGTNTGVELVSVTDGYFGNPEIRIPFPKEAADMESTLRSIGLGDQVDEMILSLNRAAELAASEAAPIFVSAIRNMTITDALDIVRGTDNAATQYLERNTSLQLNTAFRPIVASSLEKVDATKYWDDVANAYNKIPFVKRINPDLAGYVTEMAIEGLFVMIAREELKIRKDPMARTTELLQRVFGQ